MRSSGHHTKLLLPESPTVYEQVKREQGGKKYVVMTRKYMSEGHDGFECLAVQKYVIDETSGQTMSAVVRKYLLGECNELQVCQSRSKDTTGLARVKHVNNPDVDKSPLEVLDPESGKITEETAEAKERAERESKIGYNMPDALSVEDSEQESLDMATHEGMTEN